MCFYFPSYCYQSLNRDLIYKLNFIVNIYVLEEIRGVYIYRLGTIQGFRHLLRGLGIYPAWTKCWGELLYWRKHICGRKLEAVFQPLI